MAGRTFPGIFFEHGISLMHPRFLESLKQISEVFEMIYTSNLVLPTSPTNFELRAPRRLTQICGNEWGQMIGCSCLNMVLHSFVKKQAGLSQADLRTSGLKVQPTNSLVAA